MIASVLDQLSGELCDAFTGRADSQAMLEQVERAGLFPVPTEVGVKRHRAKPGND